MLIERMGKTIPPGIIVSGNRPRNISLIKSSDNEDPVAAMNFQTGHRRVITGIFEGVWLPACVVVPGLPVMRDRVPGDMNQW
jgi:hypothetical protein